MLQFCYKKGKEPGIFCEVTLNQSNKDDGLRSPIRPQGDEPLRKRIMPSIPKPTVPDTSPLADPTATQSVDQVMPSVEKAQQALEKLRQKMTAIAEEYNQGKINRAQFHAIYNRYQEQQRITEMLIERDPDSGAWQSVVQPGHTSFLRSHHESKVESYAIYHLRTHERIARSGRIQVPTHQIEPILTRLSSVVQTDGPPPPAHRRVSDRRWVLFVPGNFTLSVVIFSQEPAAQQVNRVTEMQEDFERANNDMLQRDQYDARSMVFPHRALFEQ